MEASGSIELVPPVSQTPSKTTRRRKTRYLSSKATAHDLGCENDLPKKKSDECLHKSEACEDLRVTRVVRKRLKVQHLDESKQLKIQDIENALKAVPVDDTSLRQLAITRGGLLTDDIRCKVWPHLLSINIWETSPKPLMSDVEKYRDYNQVVLDVNRCLSRFPPDVDEDVRLSMQNQLVFLIVRILIKHPELHYYQGFHDICITFLLAVGEEMSFALIEQLSKTHLKKFLGSTMEKTVHMLNYLFPIVGRENPLVREHLEIGGVGTIFCLSWLITWFAHVLNDYRHIVRLYDFFLANEPLMPIYLAAAIVLYRESDILEADCDMATLHSLLSKLPPDLPFEDLISKSGDLYLNYPPIEFEAEVADLNRNGLMKFDDPSAAGDRLTNKDSLKSLTYRYSQILYSSRLIYLLVPPWIRERKTFMRLFACTAVATGLTVLYSYLSQGQATKFLTHR